MKILYSIWSLASENGGATRFTIALHYINMPLSSLFKGWIDTFKLKGRLATEINCFM